MPCASALLYHSVPATLGLRCRDRVSGNEHASVATVSVHFAIITWHWGIAVFAYSQKSARRKEGCHTNLLARRGGSIQDQCEQ